MQTNPQRNILQKLLGKPFEAPHKTFFGINRRQCFHCLKGFSILGQMQKILKTEAFLNLTKSNLSLNLECLLMAKKNNGALLSFAYSFHFFL